MKHDEKLLLEEDNSDKYLVIVQVFNDASNAIEFSSVDIELQYILLNNKYYVYAFASKDRSEAEEYRSEYRKKCWILDPK